MAKQFHLFLVNNCESAWDIFDVGYAIGIETFYYTPDLVRNFNLLFCDHFEVLYLNKGSGWCYQCNLIYFVGIEIGVTYFDDSFLTIFLAVEVVAKQNLVLVVFQVKDMQNFKDIIGGNMIDYSSVFDGCNIQMALFFYSFL